MTLFQILVITLIIWRVLATWFKTRKGILSMREALVATVVWTALIVVALIPNAINSLGALLGFEVGANALFTISIVGLIWASLSLNHQLKLQNKQLTKLVRAEALKDL